MNASYNLERFERNKAIITLLVVLAAESVVFGLLVSVYFYLRTRVGSGPLSAVGPYDLAFPLANTLVLIVSAVCAWRSVKSLEHGDTHGSTAWIWIALVLGLVFVAGQVFEYQNIGLHVSDPSFGGAFFSLMGFHALHVLGGGVFLVINAFRLRAGDFSSRNFAPVVAGAWFWYYVCFIWLVLFVVLFLV